MASCTRWSDDEEAAGALLSVTLILYGTYHPHRSTHGMRECQPHILLWQHNICICKHLKIKFFLKVRFHIFHKTSFLTLYLPPAVRKYWPQGLRCVITVTPGCLFPIPPPLPQCVLTPPVPLTSTHAQIHTPR